MEFSVSDRIALLELLSKLGGNLLLLRQVRDLQHTVEFTEAEHALLEFKQAGGTVVWKTGKVPPVSVTVPPAIHAALADLLQRMNEGGQLSMAHLPLCDLFLPDGPDA